MVVGFTSLASFGQELGRPVLDLAVHHSADCNLLLPCFSADDACALDVAKHSSPSVPLDSREALSLCRSRRDHGCHLGWIIRERGERRQHSCEPCNQLVRTDRTDLCALGHVEEQRSNQLAYGHRGHADAVRGSVVRASDFVGYDIFALISSLARSLLGFAGDGVVFLTDADVPNTGKRGLRAVYVFQDCGRSVR